MAVILKMQKTIAALQQNGLSHITLEAQLGGGAQQRKRVIKPITWLLPHQVTIRSWPGTKNASHSFLEP